MDIKQNYQLKDLNTFGVEVTARFFVAIETVQDLRELLVSEVFKNNKHFILGGGSNIVFIQDFDGFVIKNNLLGKKILEENDEYVKLRVMSGENWHNLVMWTTGQGWGGIENLALIPGTVGATPVQNIGAYGVEIKETLESVNTLEFATGKEKVFTAEECGFGYRDSIFKKEAKGKYFITDVTFKLLKKPITKIEYGSVGTELASRGITSPTIEQIRDTVIVIRQSKLPDPKQIGNAGSFFKNPVVSLEIYQKILEEYPKMPSYNQEYGVKIPAGWLIEQAGWKGKRVGNVGVHDKQALVIVNYGGATGNEIRELAYAIIASVQEKFGIKLEPEVNMI